MGMKTPCLGAHSGSLNKTLVARTRNLGALGDRAPIWQQPWIELMFLELDVWFIRSFGRPGMA